MHTAPKEIPSGKKSSLCNVFHCFSACSALPLFKRFERSSRGERRIDVQVEDLCKPTRAPRARETKKL